MARNDALAVTQLRDTPTHRLIASRYPTIDVFDFMPDAEAAVAAMALEGATNDRLNDVQNKLARLAAEDRAMIGRPTASLAMAAFLHTTAQGGRFNGPELGAWYAGLEIETAIAETLYHHGRRLRLSRGGFPASIQMRELIARPAAALVDVTGRDDAALYDPNDYSASQRFAGDQRRAGADGILYRSVRHDGGRAIAIFKPRLLLPVTQGAHYQYNWNRAGQHTVTRLAAA